MDRFSNAADHHPAAPPHHIGPAILAGGLLIWALVAPQFHYLVSAFTTTLTMQRTYDLILALYFVMCANQAAYQQRFRRMNPRPATLICQQKNLHWPLCQLFSATAFAGRRTFFCAHRRSGQPQYEPYQRELIKPAVISGSGISLNFPVPSYPR